MVKEILATVRDTTNKNVLRKIKLLQSDCSKKNQYSKKKLLPK
jgi:hypothetical protein